MQWLLALALATTAELGQRPVAVEYTAPAECPTRQAFQDALAARTDRVRFSDAKLEATATVTVSVARKGRRFEGRLLVETQDGARTRRSIEGQRCDSLVRAMSLLAALVLDPEGAKTGPLTESPAPVITPVEPLIRPPEPVVPPPEPVVTPPEPVITPPLAVGPVPPSLGVAVREYELDFRVAGLASSSVSGLVDGGAGGRVSLWLGRDDQLLRLCLGVGAGVLTGRIVSADVGRALYPARFLGEVDVGAGLTWGAARIELGVFVQLAPVWVEGLDGDRLLASQRWLWAIGPRGGLSWRLGGWVLGVRAGIGFGLRLESYLVQPRGPVFTVPLTSFSGALEWGHQLPW